VTKNYIRIKWVREKREYPLLWLLLNGLLLLMLGGCAGADKSSEAHVTPTATQSHGAQYGCPNNIVVTSPPTPPDIVIRPAQNNTTITVHLKDLVEMQMPFGHIWQGPTNSQDGLHLQSPSGYAWKADQACIWRFVADRTGTTEVTFLEKPLCRKGQPCPLIEILIRFTLNVVK
jgi:hypothetical protein